MKKIKPKNHTKAQTLICDCIDLKKYLSHYRILKFYVRHGMIVEKIHENISLKQSRWFQTYFSFITQKRKRAKNDFARDFHRLHVKVAFGKMMENVRNRLILELFKKDDIKNIIIQQ